ASEANLARNAEVACNAVPDCDMTLVQPGRDRPSKSVFHRDREHLSEVITALPVACQAEAELAVFRVEDIRAMVARGHPSSNRFIRGSLSDGAVFCPSGALITDIHQALSRPFAIERLSKRHLSGHARRVSTGCLKQLFVRFQSDGTDFG